LEYTWAGAVKAIQNPLLARLRSRAVENVRLKERYYSGNKLLALELPLVTKIQVFLVTFVGDSL